MKLATQKMQSSALQNSHVGVQQENFPLAVPQVLKKKKKVLVYFKTAELEIQEDRYKVLKVESAIYPKRSQVGWLQPPVS